MKTLTLAGALAFGCALAAPVHAQPSKSNVCLRTTDIRDTNSPDDRTIIFHMNNGKVWRNDLRGPCPGLKFDGFAYEVSPPNEICGNLQIIHVLHSHAVCSLGAFTEVITAPDHMQK